MFKKEGNIPNLKSYAKRQKFTNSSETNEENPFDMENFINSVIKDNLTEVCFKKREILLA